MSMTVSRAYSNRFLHSECQYALTVHCVIVSEDFPTGLGRTGAPSDEVLDDWRHL